MALRLYQFEGLDVFDYAYQVKPPIRTAGLYLHEEDAKAHRDLLRAHGRALKTTVARRRVKIDGTEMVVWVLVARDKVAAATPTP